MKRPAIALFLVSLFVATAPVLAGELEGVDAPETLSAGDASLVLNGMGLRKKAFIKVYVGSLYLESKSSDPAAILAADGARHLTMHFKFNVGASRMCDAWIEGLADNTPSASEATRSQFETLCGWMEDMGKGEEMSVTYLPGTGTEIRVKGTSKGTLEGKDFADALFACWLGPEPPSTALKNGLLGR